MATSGTVAFNLSIEEIIEDAFERCGGQARAGYDLRSARRSLNLLLSEWGNRGLHYWEIGNESIKLTEGQTIYDIYFDATMFEMEVQLILRLFKIAVLIFIMLQIF